MSCWEDPVMPLAEALLGELQRMGLSLSVAESCSGGRLCSAVTAVPGASSCFLGGLVAYSNQVKEHILGVSRRTLEEDGAVSSSCAMEMAEGCAVAFGSSVAVSVTGVAGPSGGSPAKPVGTVWFGFRLPWGSFAEMRLFDGSRGEVQWSAVAFVLGRLLDELRLGGSRQGEVSH